MSNSKLAECNTHVTFFLMSMMPGEEKSFHYEIFEKQTMNHKVSKAIFSF